MDIIKIGSDELPIDFPFQAIVDLMGDDSILDYLNKYQGIGHQIDILTIGIKYGGNDKSKQYVAAAASENPRILKAAFKKYDSELATFCRIYFSEDESKETKELSAEEIEENKKKVKH